MKKQFFQKFISFLLAVCFWGIANGQTGRVVINEFMPWPGNACGTTAEFVELYNLGPGPVNIGCYILSDGDFSITIPSGTILQPGQFYVLSGQSVIPAPCANISRAVVADLNWNTCGCTSAPIPTTGDGFMTDGGFATEQLALLSPGGLVVDAVARGIPAEPSSNIISSTVSGCPSRRFNLDLMGINYETIGESAGRGNSIARKLDGDCGWVKDTQQSGGATNNTPGATSAFSLSMFITEEINCTGGTARFLVNNVPASTYFPLDYILGYDSDGDGQFTFADTYTIGSDNTAPDLSIGPLPLGLYSINIGPVQGCSYKSFIFRIGPCIPLAYSLESFTVNRNKTTSITAALSGADELEQIILEASINGTDFVSLASLPFTSTPVSQFIHFDMENSEFKYFRLMMVSHNSHVSYSPVRKLNNLSGMGKYQLSGNPVWDEIRISGSSMRKENAVVQVINTAGQLLITRSVTLDPGENQVNIPVHQLAPGLYFVKLSKGGSAPETFRVIKQ